jgi:hypothetical protein
MLYAKRVSKASLLLALVLIAAAGCGTDQILAPTAQSEVGTPFIGAVEESPTGDASWWTQVASGKVMPGQSTVISGSRYTLTFPKGSVKKNTIVTISEHHPNIVDVKLGPSDTVFKKPVTLTMYYGNTTKEPPRQTAYAYDPATGKWNSFQGVDDPVARTYTVELDHFSRFGLSSPGVEAQPPRTNGENVETF